MMHDGMTALVDEGPKRFIARTYLGSNGLLPTVLPIYTFFIFNTSYPSSQLPVFHGCVVLLLLQHLLNSFLPLSPHDWLMDGNEIMRIQWKVRGNLMDSSPVSQYQG